MNRRRSPAERIGPFDIVNVIILIALALVMIYPIYYILVNSLSDGKAVMRGEVFFWPSSPNIESYKAILGDNSVLRAYLNTIVYTVAGTLVNLVMTAMCAYPLSRKDFSGRKPFSRFVIFTMCFSGGMIPLYMVIQRLGLLNSIFAIILPPAINSWYMIMMRVFFESIPSSLHESATMDGANDITIFVRIILPLSIPVIASLTVFYAVWHWNSFFPSILYLDRRALYPIQVIMRSMVIDGQLQGTYMADVTAESAVSVVDTTIKYAVIMITTIPILTVYPFVQKYFVKGMMVGAVKG